jgi:2-keto-4-pentenoate hydratase/2-oxohepta-3-ene-1,7-dioic acid hydratase in catechol pathway
MRIAAVLHDASSDHDGAPLLPTLALERDGALYGVAALARELSIAGGSREAPDRCGSPPRFAALMEGCDFQEAVIALGGVSLRELDERLRSGERPSRARILPGAFTWLPPCDPERATYVICGAASERGTQANERAGEPLAAEVEPSFEVGSARAFFGHEATVPCCARGDDVAIACGVAAVLGDDLFRATALEADEAILGFTLVLGWTGGLGAQLGPVLVTREEIRTVTGLRAQIRVDGVALPACELDAGPFSPAEAIAWTSHHLPLRAGDVIRVAQVRAPHPPRVAFGARVDVAVEKLGRLAGKPSRGPEMRAWRRL